MILNLNGPLIKIGIVLVGGCNRKGRYNSVVDGTTKVNGSILRSKSIVRNRMRTCIKFFAYISCRGYVLQFLMSVLKVLDFKEILLLTICLCFLVEIKFFTSCRDYVLQFLMLVLKWFRLFVY